MAAGNLRGVEIRARDDAEPFITTDGSTIRSLLDRSNAPVANQSLAEATIEAGEATTRHHHRVSEEIYYLVEGTGEMELDGEIRAVGAGRRDPDPARGVAPRSAADRRRAGAAALRLRSALDAPTTPTSTEDALWPTA